MNPKGKQQKRIPTAITGTGTCVWITCNDGTIWNSFGSEKRPADQYWQQAPSIPQS